MGMKTKFKSWIAGIAALCMAATVGCGGDKKTPLPKEDPVWAAMTEQERTVAMLAGTDDFSRTFTLSGGADKDKYVGMFYFTLHGQIPRDNIYNVSEITNGGKNNDAFYAHAEQRPENTAYFWGKPVWDYYSQTDPWVVRKQLEMLTMAGVDFLFIDVTNAFTNAAMNDNTEALLFVNATYLVMDLVHEYAGKGWNVPKLMFYTNNNGTNGTQNSACTQANDDINIVKTIYNKFYLRDNGKYDDVWFAPNGKPLIVMTKESRQILAVADEDEEPDNYAVSRYFEFKYTIWPNDREEDPADLLANSFPWMEKYFDGNYLKNRGGVVNVSVAQHMNTIRFSDTTANYGRGYDYTAEAQTHTVENWGNGTHTYTHTAANNKSDRQAEAINYEYLWRQVVNSRDAVNMVTLTGWNEWTASTVKLGGKMRLVDCFNEEYSRDIEPTYGEYKDNTYLQTARNIRDYKFTVPIALTYPAATVDVTDFTAENWKSGKKYLDFTGECTARSAPGWVTDPQSSDYRTLTDDSNNNDIESVTVLHDDSYVYFRIAAADDIKAAKAGRETAWMNILLQTQEGAKGFDIVVNRTQDGNACSVQRAGANGQYTDVGTATMAQSGKYLQIAVPRAALGLPAGTPRFTFKVCDNVGGDDDILAYYNTGDAAPIGRLAYVYGK